MIVEVATCETFQVFVIRHSGMSGVGISLRGPCYIVLNGNVAERVVEQVGRCGSVVLELRRTWRNRDVMIVVVSLVPAMIREECGCKMRQAVMSHVADVGHRKVIIWMVRSKVVRASSL